MARMSVKSEDLEKVFRSPTLFAIHIIGIKPFDYQVRLLEDESKRIIVVGGRGIGKTTTLGLKALWNAFVKPDYEVLIVAPTLRQSKIMYETIRKLILRNKLVAKRAKITMHETRFDNGSVIRIAPIGEKGEVARGYHVDMLIFDEAAFMPDEAIVSIEPSVTSKDGVIIYSSTPYGTRNRFYELYMQFQNVWSIYQIPSWKSPLITDDFLNQMRESMTEEQFMQEYGAKFIDEVGMLYPFDLVLRNSKDYEYYAKWDGGNTVMGVDVASGTGKDASAIVVVLKEDDYYKVIYAKDYSGVRYVDFADTIMNIAKRYSVETINIERNGVGDAVYNLLNEKNIYGFNINGFYAVGKERMDMYFRVKALLEQNKVILNKNDRKMLEQSANYEVSQSKDGNFRIVKGSGHDDLWDALVYALYERVMNVEVFGEIMEVI